MCFIVSADDANETFYDVETSEPRTRRTAAFFYLCLIVSFAVVKENIKTDIIINNVTK